MFVDSHCHLNYAGLAERQQTVLDAARASALEHGAWVALDG